MQPIILVDDVGSSPESYTVERHKQVFLTREKGL